VLVPVDKAANNVIVIYKKFYIDVLSNELKSIHTYKKVNNSEMEIFDSHDSFNNKHDIKVEEDFKNLPSIHWLPKVSTYIQKQLFFVFFRLFNVQVQCCPITKII